VTWADEEMSKWVWTGTRNVSRRLVWAVFTRAESITVSAGDFHIEYVPDDREKPLNRVELAQYFDSVRRLVVGDDPRT